jgi:hypothetical protein
MIYLAIPSKCSPSKRYVQLFGLSFTGLNIKFMLPINLNTTVDAFDTKINCYDEED